MIEEDYGFKGGYIALRLMAMVYEQGYYLDWEDNKELTVAKRIGNGFTGALVMDVLRSCLKHGLFEKKLFDEHMVLTSNGIQKRWLQVMTQLRRKVEVNSQFWIVSSEETATPETFSTQKEIKGNEIKGKKIVAPKAPTHAVKSKKFIPPNADEVEKYFLSTFGNAKKPGYWPADKCRNEAAALLDHYTANGWVQNRGKPIRDWQASCRTWIRNEMKGAFKKDVQVFKKENIPRIKEVIQYQDKMQQEINYLFGRFIEDEKNVTIISILPVHYDCLRQRKLLQISDSEKSAIEKMALDQLNGTENVKNILDMMKRIAVLEYFKKLKSKTLAVAE